MQLSLEKTLTEQTIKSQSQIRNEDEIHVQPAKGTSHSHHLQQHGKATEKATHQSQQAKGLTSLESSSTASTRRASGGSLLSTTVAATSRSRSAAEASVDRLTTADRSASRRARRGCAHHGARQGRGVLSRRALSTTRVVLTAVGCASVVVSAVAHALVSPLLTDEVGQRLGVFGDVWDGAVAADALVGQSVGITGVLLGDGGVGGGLEADELEGHVSMAFEIGLE